LYLTVQDEAEDEFFLLRGGEVVFVGPIASFAASGGGFRILWLAIGGRAWAAGCWDILTSECRYVWQCGERL